MALGIIGGSGVYDPDVLKDIKQIKHKSQYGLPSDIITKGMLGDKEVFIIPRHGLKHQFGPTEVPYRANIWSLKELGVTKLITVSAVGSLKEAMRPGDLVITDQFIDATKKRDYSFTGRYHIGMAEPFCPVLRANVKGVMQSQKLRFHDRGTCVVIEGPRFSTKAESKLYRSWDADIINMTMVPEVVLAREAEICYVNIAMVTDYDVWKEHTVSHEEVLRVMKENMDKVRNVLTALIPLIDDKFTCTCNTALKGSGM